ncbi:HD domain-containing protein [Reticulibacter mediterranei]|nr:hypothetical protein [Reticulibacter mediterranei]
MQEKSTFEHGVDDALIRDLGAPLRNRLAWIIQEIPHFWEQSPYMHFTNHGSAHSERIYQQKLAQLAQELPNTERLSSDEVFIVSAAAWLYEIGMQSKHLEPTLDFKYQPGVPMTLDQLQEIRKNKHELSRRLIIASAHGDASLRLGITNADEYTHLIAQVCGWCSQEPLEEIPETLPLRGIDVRTRLMVALLRFADQLYIDGSRVNLDLLQAAPLPIVEKTRWWAYHYTQTLPIDKEGYIRFDYFIPLAHKELIRHIRALFERDFETSRNPAMLYLRKHGLRLSLDESPSIRFDQQDEFKQPMSSEMVSYLREKIKPKPPTIDTSVPPILGKETEERHLLVLDYENFILDLGLAGHFLSLAQIKTLFTKLLIEARKQFSGSINGLAVGHWERPDMRPIVRMLNDSVYDLLTVSTQARTAETLVQALKEQVQANNPPQHFLLVAPRQDMAPTIRPFLDRKHEVSAWISDAPDDIYQAIIHRSVKSLTSQLGLEPRSATPLDPEQRALLQAACILRIDRNMGSGIESLPFDKVYAILKEIDVVGQKADWWYLWLIQQEILLPIQVNENFTIKLNGEHPAVIEVQEKCKAILEALQSMTQSGQDLSRSQGSQGVPQDTLLETLTRLILFRSIGGEQERQEYLLQFLSILNDEGLLQCTTTSADHPVWYLNTSDIRVVKLNAPRYLPQLALGIDHFLVREGYPVMHEHSVARRLTPYVGERFADAVYRLALERQWVQRQEPREGQHHSGNNRVEVWLTSNHKDVSAVMLNRNIVLDTLYRKNGTQGVARDAFWSYVAANGRFTLTQAELDEWLGMFQRDGLLSITADQHNHEHDCLHFNNESRAVQRLLGRMHLCGVVLTLRIMGATHPDRKKNLKDAVERMASISTHGNKDLASWAIEYAKSIKLVEFSKQSTPEGGCDVLFLKRHNFVYQLDQREPKVCQDLRGLVARLSVRRSTDGWVARPEVLKEMETDSCFGLTQGEYEYWINQAVRRRVLDRRTDRIQGRAPQNYLRVLSSGV